MKIEEVLLIYKDMQEKFGDNLPDPVHSPREFAYYVMLYYHGKKYGY